ncbi:hypothetical protein [Streptomyces violaceorubidus]|uniref:hypothetical protein n=1 Tax=Streptomyces violaceorubidus TaxID=284042 RepID=UPI0004C2499C|nr:hypothetical protein [Streptomyces violaceorubidus]
MRVLLSVAAPVLTALACTAVTVAPARATASTDAASASARHVCSPRVEIDGFSDALDKTTSAGIPVAELSGLTHDTNGIDGVTVTGRTPDGRLRLLLVSDDNQRATQTTRLYSLTARLPRT